MLAARFQALRDRTIAAVDRTFAESVTLSFLKNGVVDADRPAVQIEAVLRSGDGQENMVSGGRDRDWRSRVEGQRSQLHIDRAVYPDIVVRKGDKVRALARPGQPWFEVLTVEDRGHTRLVLHLGEV
jgi:hypothetical protein